MENQNLDLKYCIFAWKLANVLLPPLFSSMCATQHYQALLNISLASLTTTYVPKQKFEQNKPKIKS